VASRLWEIWRFFGCHNQGLRKASEWHFKFFLFRVNQAKIRIFRVFDWLFSLIVIGMVEPKNDNRN